MSRTAPRKQFTRAQLQARTYWRSQLATRADEADRLCRYAAGKFDIFTRQVLRRFPDLDLEDIIQGTLLRAYQMPPSHRRIQYSTWIVNAYRYHLHFLSDRQGANARNLRTVSATTHDGEQAFAFRGRDDDELQRAGMAEAVSTALQQLGQQVDQPDWIRLRLQRVIELRYGLNGQRPHTLKQCGDRLGLSKESIRQIEARAFAFLESTVLRSYAPTAEAASSVITPEIIAAEHSWETGRASLGRCRRMRSPGSVPAGVVDSRLSLPWRDTSRRWSRGKAAKSIASARPALRHCWGKNRREGSTDAAHH